MEKNAPATWEGLVLALADAQRPLWRAWRCITHLLSVCNSEGWRKVQKKYQGDLVAFELRVGQSRRFYDRFKELKGQLEAEAKANPSAQLACRIRILEKNMSSAELSGVALEGAKQKRFNEIQEESEKLEADYRDHVLDATKAFSVLLTTKVETEGLLFFGRAALLIIV